ncbi:MAG: phage/plasmid primase, P4 family [Desulfobulbus sp.]|jgi:putative DNA primase/helicase
MTDRPKFNPDAIPEALKALPNWVGWAYGELRPNGKRAKPPVDIQGRKIDPTNPANWLDFDEAVTALQEEGGSFDGIGFALSADDQLVCIDLDDCVDDAGRPSTEAQAILDQFASYTERSPSGEGFHIWLRAELAKSFRKGLVEVYGSGRYITMTGQRYGQAKAVSDHQRELDRLGGTDKVAQEVSAPCQADSYTGIVLDNSPLLAVDEALIERIRMGKQGLKFDTLMAGDLSPYNGDQSSADLALLSILAWHCKGDTAQMSRIFGVSELAARAKWQDRPDYQQRTIQKALQNQQATSNPDLTTGVNQPSGTHPVGTPPEDIEAALADLVEATREDCGAPFMNDAVSLLAQLKKEDKARFMLLRQELKRANNGVLLGELGKDIRKASRRDKPRAGNTGFTQPALGHLPPEVRAIVAGFSGCLVAYDENDKASLVPQSIAATRIGAALKGLYSYDEEGVCWRFFDGSSWQECSPVSFDRAVTALLLAGAGELGFPHTYEVGVGHLIMKSGGNLLPEALLGRIPFQNGLLDLSTRELAPATPESADTWHLPYQYQTGTGCPNFLAWLQQAVDGDEATVQLLRGWINALLVGRADLQYFLHLLGAAGTGKSTFGRLVFALIGKDNRTTTTLRELETNRFETAGLFGKRLVAVEDADKYGGAVNTLKAMTGRDPLRLERKNQQQRGSFVFEGQVLLMSNERLASTDYTSGIERRRITVEFQRRISPEEQADWAARGGEAAILHAEIPGIIEWALGLTRQEVTNIFKHRPERVRLSNLEAAMFNNPVVDWMLHNLLPDKGAATQVGIKQEDRSGGITTYANAQEWLYANYLTWCLGNGREALGLRRFSETLVDAAKSQGLLEVYKKKTAGGHKVFGLRIRKGHEAAWIDRIETPEERKPVQTSLPTGGEPIPPVVIPKPPTPLFQEPPVTPHAGPVHQWQPKQRGAPL